MHFRAYIDSLVIHMELRNPTTYVGRGKGNLDMGVLLVIYHYHGL